ncbi:hypothetical protein LCGC14_1758520, partial [marine sediment metagenome]
NNIKEELKWIYNLKEKVPQFLKRIKGRERRGFYKYSLSGDLFGERIKWGLGNAVFFLKIIYTLNLEKAFKLEVKDAINFVQSFQKRDGSICDPLVSILSFPLRFYIAFRTLKFRNIMNNQTKRAETRQSFSALSLFNIKPQYEYRKIPKDKKQIKKYLEILNWEFPWGAGSHFSHLLFFLQHSKMKDKNELIDYAINRINRIQNQKDGFWYKGNPSSQQKINGAMKIITGLKAINKVKFNNPKKIIDGALLAKNDEQACNNFNIVYVLNYCNKLTQGKYKYLEIKDFMLNRLEIYKQYYYPKIGGFSFYKNRANKQYYGAFISRGKNEPDIHGTILFLWGISIIAKILKINEDLQLKEHIT